MKEGRIKSKERGGYPFVCGFSSTLYRKRYLLITSQEYKQKQEELKHHKRTEERYIVCSIYFTLSIHIPNIIWKRTQSRDTTFIQSIPYKHALQGRIVHAFKIRDKRVSEKHFRKIKSMIEESLARRFSLANTKLPVPTQ